MPATPKFPQLIAELIASVAHNAIEGLSMSLPVALLRNEILALVEKAAKWDEFQKVVGEGSTTDEGFWGRAAARLSIDRNQWKAKAEKAEAEARCYRILLGAYQHASTREAPFGQVMRDLGCSEAPLDVPVEIRFLDADGRPA